MRRDICRVWRTIKTGTGLKSADDFRGALKDGGISVTVCVNNIFDSSAFVAETKESEIDLVAVSYEDFGINIATCQEICDRAERLGLKICPPETAPQICLQCRDLPTNKLIVVVVDPKNIFHLRCFGKTVHLNGLSGEDPGCIQYFGCLYVFCLSRK